MHGVVFTLRSDSVADGPCADVKFSARLGTAALESMETHTKVKVEAITCFVRPATFPVITARLRTATAPNPCVKLEKIDFRNNAD